MRASAATTHTRRALEDAERRFVARVMADGGIGPWRAAADQRLQTALDTFSRHGRLPRRVAADLIVALVDKPIRDRCWQMIESQTDVDWQGFWVHLSGRALPPYRAEPLFLLAWSAWRLADVWLARAAAGDVLAQDAGHQAGGLLLALLSLTSSPAGWRHSAAERQPGPGAS